MSATGHFPIKIQLAVVMTNGENFADLSGIEFFGHIPSKADVLESVAKAVLALEEQGIEGFRLPTPEEFAEQLALEKLGARIAIAGCPDQWEGFTQAELDVAVEAARARKAEREEDEDDD